MSFLKPLSKWAGKKQSDADKANNYDRDASGSAVMDGYVESDPNGMGPVMRPVYDATAGAFTSENDQPPTRGGFNGADMHNDHYPAPYPRRQKGAVACGYRGKRTGDDERPGVSGKWPGSDV